MARANPVETKNRIKLLRAAMKRMDIAVMLVPRTDEYQGEYVPACSERLKWITGFSGSFGLAMIGTRSARLLVDGRYTIQAAKETADTGIIPDNFSFDKIEENLRALAGAGSKIGFDPWLTTTSETRRLHSICGKLKMQLQAIKSNPVDLAWHDRPPAPASKVVDQPLKFAGRSIQDKFNELASALKKFNAQIAVISDPMSVAWMLNIRGSDVPFTPVALLRALLHADGTTTLFVNKKRLDPAVLQAFGKIVRLREPHTFETALTEIANKKKAVLIDPLSTPEAVSNLLFKGGARIIEAADLCIAPRAIKNLQELKGARAAHLRDGTAMCNFLAWLNRSSEKLTERQAENALKGFREATGKLVDLSFNSISASGPNAALPHYHVTGTTGRRLRDNEIFLIDSGGQYRDGTTDITRTVIIGRPTAEMQKHFTLVLKGMIAVSVARFPAGTNGAQIDTLARSALWKYGLDFDHGTGHGVGSFLSVHEGPVRISKAGSYALQPGMILSNEPGYYRPGQYGIRIENLLTVNPLRKPKGGERKMMSFETLSFVPIDRQLVTLEHLNDDELDWLNSYHAKVLTTHENRVEVETLDWLRAACAPIKRQT